jgi:hypothetical protein
MQVVTGTLGTLFTFTFKEPAFAADYIVSLLFSVVLVLEGLFFAEINFGQMLCIPTTSHVDAMLNRTARQKMPAYVNLLCATEIRSTASRLPFYFAKVGLLALAGYILFQFRTYMRAINKNACVLARQRLPQHMLDGTVDVDVAKYEGERGIAWRAVRDYLQYKTAASAVYSCAFLVLTVMQYAFGPWREIIMPNAIACTGTMKHFNRERNIDLRCHPKAEWEIFVIAVVSTAFQVCFWLALLISILSTRQYLHTRTNFRRRTAHSELTPGFVYESPDVVAGVAAICRIARDTNPDLFQPPIPRFDTGSSTPPPQSSSPPLLP